MLTGAAFLTTAKTMSNFPAAVPFVIVVSFPLQLILKFTLLVMFIRTPWIRVAVEKPTAGPGGAADGCFWLEHSLEPLIQGNQDWIALWISESKTVTLV